MSRGILKWISLFFSKDVEIYNKWETRLKLFYYKVEYG